MLTFPKKDVVKMADKKKDILKKTRNIPTLPAVLAKIIATLDDPRSSAGDMEKIIRHDQALTTKLLAVANSAYYGFRQEITSVSRAVVAMGFNEVRNLCMGLSLMGFLDPRTFRDPKLAQRLWLHALAVSEGSLIAARWSGCTDAEVSFTAGLLHDIGKVVIAAFFPDDLEELRKLMAEKGVVLSQAEKDLGLSHEEVGKAVARHWELPAVLTEVIGMHHKPRASLDYFSMVSVVHVADYIAHGVGFGDGYRTDQVELNLQALEGMNVDKAMIKHCAKDLISRQGAVVELWSKMVDADPVRAQIGEPTAEFEV
jgi:putative nucleotidyltransferase with HDIG domain